MSIKSIIVNLIDIVFWSMAFSVPITLFFYTNNNILKILIFLVATYFYSKTIMKKLPFKKLNKNSFMYILIGFIVIVLMQLFFSEFLLKKGNLPDFVDFYSNPLFDIIGSVIFVPLSEELIFRGLFYEKYFKLDQKILIFFNGVVFSLFHSFNTPSDFFIYLVMGITFMYVYIKTNNLATPILLHALVNFYVIISFLEHL